jgi:hypothetical protein
MLDAVDADEDGAEDVRAERPVEELRGRGPRVHHPEHVVEEAIRVVVPMAHHVDPVVRDGGDQVAPQARRVRPALDRRRVHPRDVEPGDRLRRVGHRQVEQANRLARAPEGFPEPRHAARRAARQVDPVRPRRADPEVEDAVLAGVRPRHERRPGLRRQRMDRRSQRAPRPLAHQPREVRQVARVGQRADDVEGRAVDPQDEQRRPSHAPRPIRG